MAMTIVETTRLVAGGVNTHLDVHVAAAIDASGGVLGVESFPTTSTGFALLHDGLLSFGSVTSVGVEGTGAYGAGLARDLRRCGLEVIEVDRPNRQARRRAGKSDTLDAVEAARAALSGRASGIAKTADGNAEAIRALLIAKRSARDTRIRCLNQIRHLGVTAPDDLRARLRGVSRRRLAHTAAAFRPTVGADVVAQATKLALQTLGRRVVDLDTTTERIDQQLATLVRATAPGVLALEGVGIDTAAILIVATGDNPQRLRSEAACAHLCGVAPIEASSGKTIRHRLNRGGNRQANHALWRIVFTRMSSDERTRTYVARRLAEGRSKPEIILILKALHRPRDLQAPSPRLTHARGAEPGPITARHHRLSFERSAGPPPQHRHRQRVA
jgi:transposase